MSENEDTSTRQPEKDAIRMFVGQIPRQWGESELMDLFDAYGEVYQLIILKERGTGSNRGCCFVTYYTRRDALEAQIALHGARTLPGMKHPVQMKPADNDPSKNSEDRKLFVGMVSKKCSEDEVRKLFSPHGSIEECIVLRDSQGNSKGCAFVQYAQRQSCINAIRDLNRSQVMEGCSGPLTVKFAETTKQKELKKMQTMNTAFGGGSSMGGGMFGGNQQFGNSGQGGLMQQGYGGNAGMNSQNNAADLQQQLTLLALTQAAGGQNQSNPLLSVLPHVNNVSPQALQALLTLLKPNQTQNTITAAVATLIQALSSGGNGGGGNYQQQQQQPPMFPHNQNMPPGSNNQIAALLSALQGQTPPPVPPPPTNLPTSSGQGGFGGMDGGGDMNSAGVDSFTQAFLQGVNQYAASQNQYGNNSLGSLGQMGGGQMPPGIGKQTEGPEGANLFIYHLPQEYTDVELASAFAPYGNVLSAKVFVDKQTNLSKCFGFVSFDNPISAQNAIGNMNGTTLGRKTLRVQLKRDNNKPY